MAFSSTPRIDPTYDPTNTGQQEIPNTVGNPMPPDIIANNPNMPTGRRIRQLIRWRVPGLGFVDMYINPQQMTTSEKKAITSTRTKGGFIVQYWGEELTSIKLNGNTGASGIEGINILRRVYRAEQDAFQKVAEQLASRIRSNSGSNAISSIANLAAGDGKSSLGSTIGGAITGMLGGSSSPPTLPTLGSLAVSVEMYYQSWVMKGYFEDFTITESVQNGVGIFTYDLSFKVLDRRGIRTNFASFNRSPAVIDPNTGNPISYYNSDYNNTPLSFKDEK
jgi:hypothetical protein